MDICVGIDPSINSSGVTVLFINDGEVCKEKFYIVKSGKLTRKEEKADVAYPGVFEYYLYDKLDANDKEIDNIEFERRKTINMIRISDSLVDILNKAISEIEISNDYVANIYVVIEGISYGSTQRTKSIFDLAGLNYLIRARFFRLKDICFNVVTPSQIKKFASGNGNCNKDVMITMFKASFPNLDLPKIDDVADSYWMSKYALKLMNEQVYS